MLTVLRHCAVGYSTTVLTLPILPTTNPSNLIFPTPLFPEMDPRTAKAESSSGPLILQLWKIHVTDYGDEAVKNASQKGFYGFVSASQRFFESSAIADTWRTRRTEQLDGISIPSFGLDYISHSNNAYHILSCRLVLITSVPLLSDADHSRPISLTTITISSQTRTRAYFTTSRCRIRDRVPRHHKARRAWHVVQR